jgi:predicted DsbA family dithiol-disulfide isomerase
MNREPKDYRACLVAIVVLCMAGAWISGQLVKQHADVWGSASAATGLFARVCQVAERAGLGCVDRAGKPWSELDIPVPTISWAARVTLRQETVPVAFVSLAYFILLGVWHGCIGPPRPFGRAWHRLILGVGVCGAGASLFYLSLMALKLSPWCVWCVILHGVNLAVVLLVWQINRNRHQAWDSAASSPGDTREAAKMTLTTREALAAVAFAATIIVGLGLYHRERLVVQHQIDKLVPYRQMVQSLRRDPDFLLREHLAQPRHEIAPHPDEPEAMGRPELVIFSNYACGHCYCAWRRVREQCLPAFDGELIVRIRYCPLGTQVEDKAGLNDILTSDVSAAAACAAEAARLQGGGKALLAMHELLFLYWRELGPDTYRRLAEEVGLDADRLVEEMQSQRVREVVQADATLARALGVNSTPSLFLDGRRVTELCDGPTFWATMGKRWSIGANVSSETASRHLTKAVGGRPGRIEEN